MVEESSTTQTCTPQASSRVHKTSRHSPPLPNALNTKSKLDMSVAQAISSAHSALSAASALSTPSESLAQASGLYAPPFPFGLTHSLPLHPWRLHTICITLPPTILSYCDTFSPDWLFTHPALDLNNHPSTAEINNMQTFLSPRKALGFDNYTPSTLKPVFATNSSPTLTGPTPIPAPINATPTTAGIDSSAPGPSDSGLALIDAGTYAFDENLLSVSATLSVSGTSTPTLLSLSTAPLSTVATYPPPAPLPPHKPLFSSASPPLPTPSSLLLPVPPPCLSMHKYLKLSHIFHGHLEQDLVARPVSLTLYYTPTLTTLYPRVRAPEKPVPPTLPPLTSPTGGSLPQKVISITLMVDTSLLNAKQKRFHDYCIRVTSKNSPAICGRSRGSRSS